MAKYKNNSLIEVDAIQWTGENDQDIFRWGGENGLFGLSADNETKYASFPTWDGRVYIEEGLWIIYDSPEISICMPDIFEATYERVE